MKTGTLIYKPINIQDPEVWSKLVSLETKTFPDLSEGHLYHILADSHERTVIMGCWDGDKIVGINGFIAHPVQHAGAVGIAYQSCLTATDMEYRGRGIFQGLINTAKEFLGAQADAAFIFGYPNKNSGPIFCKKLGFNLRGMVCLDFPTGLFAKFPSSVFNLQILADEVSDLENRVSFDARSASRWKENSPNGATQEHENYTNFLFGRKMQVKIGPVSAPLFRVGGYELNKPPIFNRLVRNAAKGCSLVRLVVPEDSPFQKASRLVRYGQNTEPLIDFPLNWPSNRLQLEAFCGLKDVF